MGGSCCVEDETIHKILYPSPHKGEFTTSSRTLYRPRSQYRAVVIGKSGAGKSTFINMVANLCQERKYSDPRIVAITQGFSLMTEDGEIQQKVLPCNMRQFKELQTDDVNAGQTKSQTQK